MRTLRRLVLSAIVAIALVMYFHCILSSRAYVRALEHAEISFAEVYKSARVAEPPTMYEYRVSIRHWTMPEESYRSQTYLVFRLWTDPRIVITAWGTQPIVSGYPVPDTPEGLVRAANIQLASGPTSVVPTGGNYFGWIARDVMWIVGGGWLLYACAVLIGAGIQFRGILRRGALVAKRGAVRGVQAGKVLANTIDEKVEALNVLER